jgi:gamma-glutamylcyclotransferase (GGCT)/AIG2-like uncharacterized protein YtfP
MMSEKSDLLFVYGTLLILENEFGQYLHHNGKIVSRGKFKGTLYDLGQYPAAVSDSQAEGFVHGTILRLCNPAEALKHLDFYEGIGQPFCEYIRTSVDVETENSVEKCWVYLYNLPAKDLKVIKNGNYLNYLSCNQK